jgi:hypothetical protein
VPSLVYTVSTILSYVRVSNSCSETSRKVVDDLVTGKSVTLPHTMTLL